MSLINSTKNSSKQIFNSLPLRKWLALALLLLIQVVPAEAQILSESELKFTVDEKNMSVREVNAFSDLSKIPDSMVYNKSDYKIMGGKIPVEITVLNEEGNMIFFPLVDYTQKVLTQGQRLDLRVLMKSLGLPKLRVQYRYFNKKQPSSSSLAVIFGFQQKELIVEAVKLQPPFIVSNEIFRMIDALGIDMTRGYTNWQTEDGIAGLDYEIKVLKDDGKGGRTELTDWLSFERSSLQNNLGFGTFYMKSLATYNVFQNPTKHYIIARAINTNPQHIYSPSNPSLEFRVDNLVTPAAPNFKIEIDYEGTLGKFKGASFKERLILSKASAASDPYSSMEIAEYGVFPLNYANLYTYGTVSTDEKEFFIDINTHNLYGKTILIRKRGTLGSSGQFPSKIVSFVIPNKARLSKDYILSHVSPTGHLNIGKKLRYKASVNSSDNVNNVTLDSDYELGDVLYIDQSKKDYFFKQKGSNKYKHFASNVVEINRRDFKKAGVTGFADHVNYLKVKIDFSSFSAPDLAKIFFAYAPSQKPEKVTFGNYQPVSIKLDKNSQFWFDRQTVDKNDSVLMLFSYDPSLREYNKGLLGELQQISLKKDKSAPHKMNVSFRTDDNDDYVNSDQALEYLLLSEAEYGQFKKMDVDTQTTFTWATLAANTNLTQSDIYTANAQAKHLIYRLPGQAGSEFPSYVDSVRDLYIPHKEGVPSPGIKGLFNSTDFVILNNMHVSITSNGAAPINMSKNTNQAVFNKNIGKLYKFPNDIQSLSYKMLGNESYLWNSDKTTMDLNKFRAKTAECLVCEEYAYSAYPGSVDVIKGVESQAAMKSQYIRGVFSPMYLKHKAPQASDYNSQAYFSLLSSDFQGFTNPSFINKESHIAPTDLRVSDPVLKLEYDPSKIVAADKVMRYTKPVFTMPVHEDSVFRSAAFQHNLVVSTLPYHASLIPSPSNASAIKTATLVEGIKEDSLDLAWILQTAKISVPQSKVYKNVKMYYTITDADIEAVPAFMKKSEWFPVLNVKIPAPSADKKFFIIAADFDATFKSNLDHHPIPFPKPTNAPVSETLYFNYGVPLNYSFIYNGRRQPVPDVKVDFLTGYSKTPIGRGDIQYYTSNRSGVYIDAKQNKFFKFEPGRTYYFRTKSDGRIGGLRASKLLEIDLTDVTRQPVTLNWVISYEKDSIVSANDKQEYSLFGQSVFEPGQYYNAVTDKKIFAVQGRSIDIGSKPADIKPNTTVHYRVKGNLGRRRFPSNTLSLAIPERRSSIPASEITDDFTEMEISFAPSNTYSYNFTDSAFARSYADLTTQTDRVKVSVSDYLGQSVFIRRKHTLNPDKLSSEVFKKSVFERSKLTTTATIDTLGLTILGLTNKMEYQWSKSAFPLKDQSLYAQADGTPVKFGEVGKEKYGQYLIYRLSQDQAAKKYPSEYKVLHIPVLEKPMKFTIDYLNMVTFENMPANYEYSVDGKTIIDGADKPISFISKTHDYFDKKISYRKKSAKNVFGSVFDTIFVKKRPVKPAFAHNKVLAAITDDITTDAEYMLTSSHDYSANTLIKEYNDYVDGFDNKYYVHGLGHDTVRIRFKGDQGTGVFPSYEQVLAFEPRLDTIGTTINYDTDKMVISYAGLSYGASSVENYGISVFSGVVSKEIELYETKSKTDIVDKLDIHQNDIAGKVFALFAIPTTAQQADYSASHVRYINVPNRKSFTPTEIKAMFTTSYVKETISIKAIPSNEVIFSDKPDFSTDLTSNGAAKELEFIPGKRYYFKQKGSSARDELTSLPFLMTPTARTTIADVDYLSYETEKINIKSAGLEYCIETPGTVCRTEVAGIKDADGNSVYEYDRSKFDNTVIKAVSPLNTNSYKIYVRAAAQAGLSYATHPIEYVISPRADKPTFKPSDIQIDFVAETISIPNDLITNGGYEFALDKDFTQIVGKDESIVPAQNIYIRKKGSNADKRFNSKTQIMALPDRPDAPTDISIDYNEGKYAFYGSTAFPSNYQYTYDAPPYQDNIVKGKQVKELIVKTQAEASEPKIKFRFKAIPQSRFASKLLLIDLPNSRETLPVGHRIKYETEQLENLEPNKRYQFAYEDSVFSAANTSILNTTPLKLAFDLQPTQTTRKLYLRVTSKSNGVLPSLHTKVNIDARPIFPADESAFRSQTKVEIANQRIAFQTTQLTSSGVYQYRYGNVTNLWTDFTLSAPYTKEISPEKLLQARKKATSSSFSSAPFNVVGKLPSKPAKPQGIIIDYVNERTNSLSSISNIDVSLIQYRVKGNSVWIDIADPVGDPFIYFDNSVDGLSLDASYTLEIRLKATATELSSEIVELFLRSRPVLPQYTANDINYETEYTNFPVSTQMEFKIPTVVDAPKAGFNSRLFLGNYLKTGATIELDVRQKAVTQANSVKLGVDPGFASKWLKITVPGRASSDPIKVSYVQDSKSTGVEFNPVTDTLENKSGSDVLLSNTNKFTSSHLLEDGKKMYLGDIFFENVPVDMYVKTKSDAAGKRFSSETFIFKLPKKNFTPKITVDYRDESLSLENKPLGQKQEVYMHLQYKKSPSDIRNFNINVEFNALGDPVKFLSLTCPTGTESIGCILNKAYTSSANPVPSASIGVLNFEGTPLVATYSIAGKYDLAGTDHSRPSGIEIMRLPLKKTADDLAIEVDYFTETTNFTLTRNHNIRIASKNHTGDEVHGTRFKFTPYISDKSNVNLEVSEQATNSSFSSESKTLTLNMRDSLHIVQMSSPTEDITSKVDKEYGFFIDSESSRICLKKNTGSAGNPRMLEYAPYSNPTFFVPLAARNACKSGFDYEISLEGLDSKFYLREVAHEESDKTKNLFTSFLDSVVVKRPSAPKYAINYDALTIEFLETGNKKIEHRYKDLASKGFVTTAAKGNNNITLDLRPDDFAKRILQVKLAPSIAPDGSAVIASDLIDIILPPIPNLRNSSIYIDHRDSALVVPEDDSHEYLYTFVDGGDVTNALPKTGRLLLKGTNFYNNAEGSRFITLVRNGSNNAKRFKSKEVKFSDNLRPVNTGTVSTDYFNETSKEIIDLDVFEYAFDVNFKEPYTLTEEGNKLKMIPGRDVYFRVKAKVGNYYSNHIVETVKARPQLSAVTFDWDYVAEKVKIDDPSANVLFTLDIATNKKFTALFDLREDKVIPGDTLYYRKSATPTTFKSEEFKQGIPKRPKYTGPTATINYRDETLNETLPVVSLIQYRTQYTEYRDLTEDKKLDVTPDVDLYLRNQAVSHIKFASEDYKIDVPGYPEIPADFTRIDFENESTLAKPTDNFQMTLDIAGNEKVAVLKDGRLKLIPGRIHYYKMFATDTSFATQNQILRIPTRPSNTSKLTINYQKETTNEVLNAYDVEYFVVQDRKGLINVDEVPASDWTIQTITSPLGFTEAMTGKFLIYRKRASNIKRNFSSTATSLAIPSRTENNVTFTLNYFTEKFDRPFSDRIEYAFVDKSISDDKFSFALVQANAKFIGSEDLVSVSSFPDKKMMYRIRASESGFASKSRAVLIPPRAEPFDFTINYDTRASNEVFAPSIEISRYFTMYNSKSGRGTKLELEDFMGTYIYYRVKADPFENKLGSDVKTKYIPGDVKIFLVDPDLVSVEREELAYIYLPQDPSNQGKFVFISESQMNKAINESNVPEGEVYDPADPYVTLKLVNRSENLWNIKYNKPNLQVNLEIKAGLLDFTLGNGETYKNFATNKLSVFYKPVNSDILTYPSPLGADDGDILTLEGKEDIYELIRVINIYGDIIFELNISDLPDEDPRAILWRRTIDFSSQPKGTYYIQMIDKDGGKSPVQPILKI